LDRSLILLIIAPFFVLIDVLLFVFTIVEELPRATKATSQETEKTKET
jgi:hypothetical protein